MDQKNILKYRNYRVRQYMRVTLAMFMFLALITPTFSLAQTTTTEDETIYEDVPDMPQSDINAVMNWIKNKTTGERLPFCWRQSYGRGVGNVPGRVADCPACYTNNGATCGRGADTIGAPSKVASCPDGYTNTGLTCYRGPSTYSKGCTTIFKKYGCKAGYTDNGCFCGRGADSKGSGSMTCPAGYSKSSITQRCIKDCPAGYTNTGETCFRTVSTLGMGSMLCNADERREGARCYPASGSCGSSGESDAGLCYPKCKAGFNGVGPVCWQKCDPNWTECAAGCAKTKLECGLVVAEQVYSPLVVAANIVTMGSASKVTMVAQGAEDVMKIQKTITIGGKTFTSATKLGKAFIKVLDVVQTIKPASVVKGTSVIKRVYIAKTGTTTAKIFTSGKVLKSTYTVSKDFYDAYSEDFETQTSAEINSEIDKRFHPMTAQFLKREWGKIQLSEMAGTNGFNIAQDVLAVVSIVDITGVTGVVSAYTKPICQDVISFPTFSQSYK